MYQRRGMCCSNFYQNKIEPQQFERRCRMSARPWMPLYVGDYLADTAHLRAFQSGGYLHLIMHYWRTGGLPDDDSQLAAIARMTPEEWKDNKALLQSFFYDGWKHKRIDAELAEAEEKYNRRASAGRKGGIAAHKPEQCPSNAQAMLDQSQSQSQSESGSKKESKTGKILLPDAWSISDSHFELGNRLGLTKEEIEEAAQEMRSWSLGNGERRANWDFVFNNWIRRNAGKKNGFGRQGKLQDDSRSASRAAGRLAERAERGEFEFGRRPSLLPAPHANNVVLLPKGRDS
jgi:uncharacterized protein YdaU (DUF1376 family)